MMPRPKFSLPPRPAGAVAVADADVAAAARARFSLLGRALPPVVLVAVVVVAAADEDDAAAAAAAPVADLRTVTMDRCLFFWDVVLPMLK